MPDKEKAMDKTLVVYGSHYGATKTYAEYIAQKLSCPCLAAESLKKGMLANCDAVVFGGGVYAGSIAGWKKAAPLIVKESPSRILLFVCGLADPAREKTRAEARMLFEKRLPENMRGLPVFCLRGGIDYAKLGLKHRAMMAMLMKFLKSKKDPSEEDRQLMATYGGKVDFTDLTSADPVIAAARGLPCAKP